MRARNCLLSSEFCLGNETSVKDETFNSVNSVYHGIQQVGYHRSSCYFKTLYCLQHGSTYKLLLCKGSSTNYLQKSSQHCISESAIWPPRIKKTKTNTDFSRQIIQYCQSNKFNHWLIRVKSIKIFFYLNQVVFLKFSSSKHTCLAFSKIYDIYEFYLFKSYFHHGWQVVEFVTY